MKMYSIKSSDHSLITKIFYLLENARTFYCDAGEEDQSYRNCRAIRGDLLMCWLSRLVVTTDRRSLYQRHIAIRAFL